MKVLWDIANPETNGPSTRRTPGLPTFLTSTSVPLVSLVLVTVVKSGKANSMQDLAELLKSSVPACRKEEPGQEDRCLYETTLSSSRSSFVYLEWFPVK